MSSDEAETDRGTFRARLQAAQRLIDTGNADAANAENEALTPIAERWEQRGQLVDLLEPLLDADEESYVRFGAASTLLSRGHADVALPALEDVRDNTRGTGALSARSLVNYWRRQHA